MKSKKQEGVDELESSLRVFASPDPVAWTATRRRLAERAIAADLVDVAFERHDSPLGALLLGATSAGLVRLGLPAEGEDAVLDELAQRISPRILCTAHDTVTRARHQLDEYFAGHRRSFDVALDWQLTGGFRREVLRATALIPFGATSSYRAVATAAGSPAAFRAAGSALATNPLPIVVPCHRVLPASGGIGDYRGGAAAKALLLELERAA